MHREPHGRLCRIGPCDAMAPMCRNVQPVPALHAPRRGFALEGELGAAGEHDHPLGLRLVVPEPGRACLAVHTMRSMRSAPDEYSAVISSSASCCGMSANRLPRAVSVMTRRARTPAPG